MIKFQWLDNIYQIEPVVSQNSQCLTQILKGIINQTFNEFSVLDYEVIIEESQNVNNIFWEP
jgi:translation elongation factor EF-Ts